MNCVPSLLSQCVECLIGKQKKPILFKVTGPGRLEREQIIRNDTAQEDLKAEPWHSESSKCSTPYVPHPLVCPRPLVGALFAPARSAGAETLATRGWGNCKDSGDSANHTNLTKGLSSSLPPPFFAKLAALWRPQRQFCESKYTYATHTHVHCMRLALPGYTR
jgi:hypothetical protein